MNNGASASEIILDQVGIIGVNPFFDANGLEPTHKALVFPHDRAFTIRNNNNARIKLCAETIDWNIDFALFATSLPNNNDEDSASNHNITIDVSCIPPDEATTRWGGNSSFFSTRLLNHTVGAGSSVRDIKLLNTAPSPTDITIANTDPFWNSYFNGQLGGAEDNINFQKIYIENTDSGAAIRTRNGGISQFGGGSQIFMNNLRVDYSGHYIGENGRNFTSAGIYEETDGGRWEFDNFEMVGGMLRPMNATADFSWYDYVAPSRMMGVSIDGENFYRFRVQNDDPTYANIFDGHNLNLTNASLPNGANLTVVIQFHDDYDSFLLPQQVRDEEDNIVFDPFVYTYGHPNYVHQDVAFDINNVTSMYGHWRYYANGDQYEEAGASVMPAISRITHSKILGTGLQFENSGGSSGLTTQQRADVTRGTLQISHSEIIARRIFGNLTLTNTTIVRGGFVFVNNFTNGGGNSYNFTDGIEVFDSDFTSDGEYYARGNKMTFSKPNVQVLFKSSIFDTITIFPEVQNGTLRYLDIDQPNSSTPRFDDNGDTNFTEQTHIIFENAVFYNGQSGLVEGQDFNDNFLQFGFDENRDDGQFNGGQFTFINSPFRNHFGWARIIRPDFPPDHVNNGMFNVTTNSTLELSTISYDPYIGMPFYFGGSDIVGIAVRPSESDKFKVAGTPYAGHDNIKIIVPSLEFRNDQKFFNVDWANGAYFTGEFTLKMTGSNISFNPYFKDDRADNKRNNSTLSNLVLKTSAKRNPNEIIRFEIDSKQNRIIEKEATIDGVVVEKYYVDVDPTLDPDPTAAFGLDGEVVYLTGDDSVSWTHRVTHNDISGTSSAITPTIVDGHTEIDTGIYFSIKQESRSEDPWEDFEFKLSDGNPINDHYFRNSATLYFASNSTPPRNVNPNYIKHFWTFQAYDSSNEPIVDSNGDPILCYIENRNGKIIFSNTFSEINALNTLTVTQGWEVTSHEWVANNVVVSPKVMLQGAALNPNVGEETLMRDDLRANSYIPTISPYSDMLTCDASVFTTTGADAIVDWVYLELRDATDNTIIVEGRSALLQRDGDVVDSDGSSAVTFHQPDGDYYVAVKHRNHLGIMTASIVTLSSSTTTVDFTDATNQITYGSHAQTTSGMQANVVAMWAGNVNGDTLIQYSGTDPESPEILSFVLNDPGNFLNLPTYVVTGYHSEDVNMDGNTQYAGTNPDTPFILQNVLVHPGNFLNFSTYQIIEQLPEN